MIHPSVSSASRRTGGTREVFLFYFVSLLISAANFLPLSVKSELDDVLLSPKTEYYLSICYYLSLPLLFEFFMDVGVSYLSSSAYKTVEPRFGFFLILVSLFLPVVCVDSSDRDTTSPCKVMFTLCYFAFLQSLIIIGQYGKLQFRTKGHWRSSVCLGIVFLYVASLVCFNFGIAYCSLGLAAEILCMGFGIVSAVGCLILHCVYSKRYILDFLYNLYQGVNSSQWFVDEYVAVALQCILFVYFLSNCFACGGRVNNMESIQSHTNSVVINHIVLGLCAAILPGRVIRKNFLLLHEKLAVKETFIRYVSHEIRSPLSTTSLGLNYLLDRLKSDEIKLSEVLEVVQESVVTCELALNTVSDFLMLDKIESNVIEINKCVRNASEFVLDAIRPFNLQAASSKIMLHSNVETTNSMKSIDAKIEIDLYKMNQVLRNLLSNAFKFTPSGGSVSVTLSVQEDRSRSRKATELDDRLDGHRHMVRFSVKDSGCGISAENLPKLFGQYVQFNAAKLQGGKGSGLGLWLSKAIVEMHGGRIGAESEGEGRGCTFWFELPCLKYEGGNDFTLSPSFSFRRAGSSFLTSTLEDTFEDHDIECGKVVAFKEVDEEIGAKPIEKKNVSVVPAGKKYIDLQEIVTSRQKLSPMSIDSRGDGGSGFMQLRVLLVDDSAIGRKMVERSLTTIGVKCAHACNGREAVEKVRQSMNNDPLAGYDVILMDHYMPEMSGPEAVEVIRNELGYKGVIMGVSGNDSTNSEFEMMLATGNVNKVVTKPFNLDLFVEYMQYKIDAIV